MNGEKETQNGSTNQGGHIVIPKKVTQAIIGLVIAVTAGLGGYSTVQIEDMRTNPQARPNAFTRTDFDREKAELLEHLTLHHETDIARVDRVIERMTDQISALDACKNRVEEQMKIAAVERGRILEILERVHPRIGSQ